MMKLTANQKEIMLDSVMYSSLFYVLANPNMYTMTSKLFPKMVKDRVLLHSVVFLVVYAMIQKITKRF
jgi:hypothetical protein